jgi:hypothetical protein
MTPEVEFWLEIATTDADRRGLPELKPLLESLARSTEALREADECLRRRAQPDGARELDNQ